jgi:opacity protein-like surface antigen
MKTKSILVIPLILACHSAVIAGQDSDSAQSWYQNGSFYTSLSGGVAFLGEGNVDVDKNPSGSADFDIDDGSAFAIALGHDFGSLRVEGQFNYTQADISSLSTNTGSIDIDSQFTSYGFMANALWDFDFKPFTVSAGGGIGFSSIEYDSMSNSGFTAVADCSDTVFTSQLIFGVGYQLSENATVGVNYRYLMVGGVDDSGDVDTGVGGESDISFDSVDASILEIFFSWRF